MEIHIEISRIKEYSLENKKRKVRVVDEFGNCVIPIEIRKELQIFENDNFKICTKDNKLILIRNANKLKREYGVIENKLETKNTNLN